MDVGAYYKMINAIILKFLIPVHFIKVMRLERIDLALTARVVILSSCNSRQFQW
jgi:hypothetical protein